ncbi:MAG: vWA domain-containing protein [Planctomycetota bacterium]
MLVPITTGVLLGGIVALADPAPHDPNPLPPGLALAPTQGPDTRRIDLAICLDTSGSMEGLIDAARTKLWDIVNDLALARPTPELRVALLTFGNDGHAAENGWVRVDSPFTEDLDLISQQLFALTTNGGTEYVGRVTSRATTTLDWHPSDDTLKLIVVAGNESADQDQDVPFRNACRTAIGRGIMVNSIYCGNPADDLAPAWREVATLADGHFAAIDHDNGTITITTPFDTRLTELSAALNETYIPYGELGEWGCSNQLAQDANAQSVNAATAAARCATKASALYNNGRWDLVDASRQESIKLEEVAQDQLPEVMQAMTLEERRAYVEQKAERRGVIQAEVAELNGKRQAYIVEETRRQSLDASRSFDQAIRRAVRDQARAKGFVFEQSVDLGMVGEQTDAGDPITPMPAQTDVLPAGDPQQDDDDC